MEIRVAIARKRAIRRFAERQLEQADLERILNAGRHAASSKNAQRWEFVVVRDRARLQALADAGPWAGHVGGAALAVALVTPNPHLPGAPLSIMFDLGMAAANMMLAAWDLGIGSCPATVYHHELVQRILGYPDDRHCEYLISLGYPADPADLSAPPRAGGRRALAEITHEERW